MRTDKRSTIILTDHHHHYHLTWGQKDCVHVCFLFFSSPRYMYFYLEWHLTKAGGVLMFVCFRSVIVLTVDESCAREHTKHKRQIIFNTTRFSFQWMFSPFSFRFSFAYFWLTRVCAHFKFHVDDDY